MRVHIEPYSAAELVDAGVPRPLFAEMEMAGFRTSATGKLHRKDYCYYVKSRRFRLQPATVPLLSLTKASCCECVSVLDLPAGAYAQMRAAAAVLAVSDAAVVVRDVCVAGQQPKLADLAVLTTARDTRLAAELATLSGCDAAAWWHAGVLADAAASLAAVEATFGADPHREHRHAAQLLTQPLADRFDATKHPALATREDFGWRPQSDITGPAQNHLVEGLRDGHPGEQIRQRVLAVVDTAVPSSIAQVPDVVTDPTLGARAAAIAAWRAQASAELAELVDEALADFDTLMQDTTEVLVVLSGPANDEQQPLLARARVLDTLGDRIAYAAVGVIAAAVATYGRWNVDVARAPLPDEAQRQRNFAANVLKLLERDMDSQAAVAEATQDAPLAHAAA